MLFVTPGKRIILISLADQSVRVVNNELRSSAGGRSYLLGNSQLELNGQKGLVGFALQNYTEGKCNPKKKICRILY